MNRTARTSVGLIIFGLAFTIGLPAGARSTTGFASFHVWGNSAGNDAYTCLDESWGAVVNNCGYPVSLVFDLPMDPEDFYQQEFSQGYGVTVKSYVGSQASFSCQVWSYNGFGNGWVGGGANTFFAGAITDLITLWVWNSNESNQVICWGIPPGAGISNLYWNIEYN
jgi:hypothetical protein